ncbi:Hypothetical protein GLP15_907 [Giardia lamblia P15]|uniref:Uncharacterized protein n=1 Tax=Giardia intestinalis (strain P15) TaxID=658858 RepID=E1EZG9_GIAIA|nr:Hypothetical protein GLP15_907 [Giardia lamblia P15]
MLPAFLGLLISSQRPPGTPPFFRLTSWGRLLSPRRTSVSSAQAVSGLPFRCLASALCPAQCSSMLGGPCEQVRDRVHCAACRNEGGPRCGSAGRGAIRRSRPGGPGLLLKRAPCEARRSASRRAASARPRGGQASGTRQPALSCGAPPRSTHRAGLHVPCPPWGRARDPKARGPTARAASSSVILEGCSCSPVAGGRGARVQLVRHPGVLRGVRSRRVLWERAAAHQFDEAVAAVTGMRGQASRLGHPGVPVCPSNSKAPVVLAVLGWAASCPR